MSDHYELVHGDKWAKPFSLASGSGIIADPVPPPPDGHTYLAAIPHDDEALVRLLDDMARLTTRATWKTTLRAAARRIVELRESFDGQAQHRQIDQLRQRNAYLERKLIEEEERW